MTCRACMQRISAFVDGGLDQASVNAMRGHMADCERCALAVADERLVKQTLRTLPAPTGGPPSWSRVRSALADADRADAKVAPWRLWFRQSALRPIAWMAVPAGLALAAWGLWPLRDITGVEVPKSAVAESLNPDSDPLTAGYREEIRELERLLDEEWQHWAPAVRNELANTLAQRRQAAWSANAIDKRQAYVAWQRTLQRALLWDRLAEAH